MKLKKLIGMAVILFVAILAFGTTKIYAANDSYVLGITNVREDPDGTGPKKGGAYGIGGLKSDNTPTKKVWKIVSYPTTTSTKIDYSNAFYCLKAEHGFMLESGNTDVTAVKKEYTVKRDMKTQKADVLAKLQAIDVFKKDATAYNKVMWILDNMYLPKAEGAASDKEALLEAAKITKPATGYTVDKVRITDDDIEVVQQLALWYFTNPDSYYLNEEGERVYTYNTTTLQQILFNNWSGEDKLYKNFEDWYNKGLDGREGKYRQDECALLYKYFIDNAKTKGNYVSPDAVSPLTLDSEDFALVKGSDSSYIIGPLTINKNSETLYTVNHLGFTDENGNTFDYILLDENKNPITNNTLSLNKPFYIKVADTLKINKVKFNMSITYSKTTTTYYTTEENNYRDAQPVVLVEKKPETYTAEAEVTIPTKPFDLSLRKFISAINGVAPTVSRQPQVSIAPLTDGNEETTTAIYKHTKEPLPVEVGSIVTYTIRVYNEGEQDGYVSEITDHLPAQLEFLDEDEDNIENGWYYDETDPTLRTIKTNHLSKDVDEENNIIKAFNGTDLDYVEVKVKCKVVGPQSFSKRIVNIADITGFTDKAGNAITDRDSQAKNVNVPADSNLPDYKGKDTNKDDLTDKNYHYEGQQDDDDFDSVVINQEYFDLALRKFITAVNGKAPAISREPKPDVSPLINGTGTTAIYKHTKEPLPVKVGDTVTYTIRVYNEGTKDGYVSEITDHLPPQLEFIKDDKENIAKGWDYDKTDTTLRTIKTSYLSKAKNENNIIKAFDGETLSYKEISVNCKVVSQDPKYSERIVNIADITGFTDAKGDKVKDIDSQESNVVLPADSNLPNYKGKNTNKDNLADKNYHYEGQQDDDDFDSVIIKYFDLALRKFITKVDSLDINNRYPVLSMGEDGNIKYTHTKEPVLVANSNIVTYTIRIYNEGTMDGYAKEITDDLPEGLVFLPENETNVNYRWIMLDENGNETKDVSKAKKVTTDYLSKAQEKTEGENLLKAFDAKAGLTQTNPDHRDVKIAFKVTEPNTSDRILINTAEISEDSDKNDDPIDDVDSTPGNDKDGEDDIDIDKVKVKYFDLALKKWVTQAIVIENGKQTVTESGHTGDENPEPVVKVDLKKSKLNKVTVKFRYKIKVTNEGQIEGYVKELKDYIPDGLKFDAKDNPKWKQVSQKIVTTDQLKDRLLQPGESATVEILLTWENSEKNLGQKVNWAEISKDYNEYGDTPDIDSTPDNNKKGEDDIDNAPVILAIKTGEARIYIGLTTIILVTLAGGVYLIKKYVL